MSIFLVDEYKDMEPYVPGEQPKDKPYIKLNANETSMPPSPKVFEAISKAEIWNMSYYADPHCHEFRRAVAEVYGVTEDEVFVGNGVKFCAYELFPAWNEDLFSGYYIWILQDVCKNLWS